ncbi:MAG: phosphoribosylformylglycinamidine synthase subunit PurL, partial [Ferruginibacter sp.]|nr:phosphoribosylformylglycinamidine synthase subunit PurL [Ferruginibacter sp.]
AEMSAKGKAGMKIHLDKVPTRQAGMKAWELLLSESQERMLLVVQKGREKDVLDVFEKWDLPCSHIGEVTGDGLLQFYMNDILEALIPAEDLVLGGGAPQYERAFSRPAYLNKIESFDIEKIDDCKDLIKVTSALIQLPNIASKRWIYEQYDSMVGAGTTNTNAPSDAAVVIAKPTKKALALTTDCNSRYVFADPYKGAMIAVAEAARNIVCSGGEPLGVTNCLNFGNPYDPEVYYQFVHAIKGMGEACLKFDTPVTGGNVSFYNQSPDGPVYPTPTIGMVGLLDDIEDKMTLDFKNEGDEIFLIGHLHNEINSSEYLHKLIGEEYSPAPYFNLEEEYLLHQCVLQLIKNKFISSAHDVSEGGLIVTLLESAFNRNLGFDIAKTDALIRNDAFWFGESQGRVVVSVSSSQRTAFFECIKNKGVPVVQLGKVTSAQIRVDGEDWNVISDWKRLYDNAITKYMD